MKFKGFGLLEGFSDSRQGKQRSIAIFSPVGDRAQLQEFCSHVKKMGLDGEADFVFIMRPGLEAGVTGLSELRCHEKLPIGTSGCFFAGQALCHSLGYETVVVADLDAFLDSRRTFDAMVEMAGQNSCAVIPQSRSSEELSQGRGYGVPNQWGVFPRQVFDKAGFAMPYTLRGGEDYEFAKRLGHFRLLCRFEHGFATHPRAGFTIYHKMAEAKKFYPYVAGLMRAMLFSTAYSKKGYLLYLAWHAYYSFFADAFSDAALSAAVKESCRLRNFRVEGGQAAFSIRKARGKAAFPSAGAYRLLFIPASILRLLLFKRLSFATDDILMDYPRPRLLFGLACAALLSPIRLAQGALSILAWQGEKKGFPFPPKPSNIDAAAAAFEKELGVE